MRLRDAVGLAIAIALLCGACSRLTFVKPSTKRGDSERVAPEYTFRDESRRPAAASAAGSESRAEQSLRNGDLVEARRFAEEALKLDRSSLTALTILGVVAERSGRTAEAGKHFARAAALSPTDGAMANNYGAWLCGNDRAAESLAWFDRALADRSYAQPSSALANAGACAAQAGQYGNVERDLRAALIIDPVDDVALGAMAAEQFRQQKYMDARAFSERRLAAAPATPAALEMASRIERALGDAPAAARYAQRLRAEFPQASTAQPGDPVTP